MIGMSTSLRWSEIALRLGLAIAAGLALGYNRSEHGKAAGLRTTVLVSVAAAVAMIQVNLLLPTAGRASDSFVMNDLMRLPLGILTGVGFIGGGAILRRGDFLLGVTTAATIWLATVIGLCLGGGQIGLGLAGTAIGLLALGPLGWIEKLFPHQRTVVLAVELQTPDESRIRRKIDEAGFLIVGSRMTLDDVAGQRKLAFDLRSTRFASEMTTQSFVHALTTEPGVQKVEWRFSK
jgi:putative Mg2+ transporter-C (MgtC) family protein